MIGTFEKMFRKLTGPFIKRRDSNVSKIFKLYAEHHDKVTLSKDVIIKANDIDSAAGVALDRIGQFVQLARDGWSDEEYRKRLKIKVAQNYSDGTINKLLEVMALVLNTSPSNIQISSDWEYGNSATIRIHSIPISVLDSSGFTELEITTILQDIVASGIAVGSVVFDGTFKYSEVGDEPMYDGKSGFGIGKYGKLLKEGKQ